MPRPRVERRSAACSGRPASSRSGGHPGRQRGRGRGILYQAGVLSLFSICTRPMTLSEAMTQASALLETAAERVARVAGLARISHAALDV